MEQPTSARGLEREAVAGAEGEGNRDDDGRRPPAVPSMESLLFRPPPSILGISSPPVSLGLDVCRVHQGAAVVSALGRSVDQAPSRQSSTSWHYMLVRPLWRLWPRRELAVEANAEERKLAAVSAVAVAEAEAEAASVGEQQQQEQQETAVPSQPVQRGNWVSKILLVRAIWGREKASGVRESKKVETAAEEEGEKKAGGCADEGDAAVRRRLDEGDRCVGCGEGDEEEEGCHVVGEGGDEVEIDKDSFSRLLGRVPLAEARVYDRLSYLGWLAYSVPKIKPGNLLRSRGLRLVTSSVDKKSRSSNPEMDESISLAHEAKEKEAEAVASENQKKRGISTSTAYQIAASAASYLQSQTKNIPSSSSQKGDLCSSAIKERSGEALSPKEASFVATTNSVTAVVAAKEEVKEAVAKDLNSPRSSPCDWFICDDDLSGTRYFVIQGSGSLASWKANLLFEPIQFEGFDLPVHRGIYEAAKGIYEQMLPEVRAHLQNRGKSATLRFTGHSLGGSLSVLVNLMLLIRGEAPASSLLPVVTFGAPSIMCGGDLLLRKLGLPRSHVRAITMHRDIVPRAFSCCYPDHVAEILKAINRNFRDHPCLKHKKLLFEPMGELLILQPEEKFSPQHHLLPSGTGLYALGRSLPTSSGSKRLLRTAQSVFLNSPHPLEILSDRSAYGSGGAVTRDHDMAAYVRSVQGVIQLELKHVRKVKRERRRQVWSSLLLAVEEGTSSGIITSRTPALSNSSSLRQISLLGVFQGGRESLKRFGRLVASQHVHMLVVFLLPARLLIIKALSAVSLS